ncbi:type II toxin-antitoxin system VapC family toxin [Synechococcus moorigangaii CMS01]|nr:type II toxin-antitoxin system VapC family toxin [Synechococcus moorigangaii CMS01]
MEILSDTHIFLWFLNKDFRFPKDTITAIRNPDNTIYLSVASIWEATIKYQLGKLPLPESPEIYLTEQRKCHHIDSLSITENTIKELVHLPNIHRDPFDRLLICHAKEKNLVFASEDPLILKYPEVEFL